MGTFDVQTIEVGVSAGDAFGYIADASRLPEWTEAFAEAGAGRARLRTPAGEEEVRLEVAANAEAGTVDWFMMFGDGSVAQAYSRIVPLDPAGCLFSFTLLPPPVPLEALEGALAEQSRTLAGELARLKVILEGT